MYPSISAGEMVSTSAMLSKPWLMSSVGSSGATSTSTASRSRTEFAYSVRFNRCSAGLPGLGWSAAAWSIPFSRDVRKTFVAAALGRGRPAGGIMPARSLRITLSASSAFPPGCATSSIVRVMFPDINLSLWQPAQY
jgi:hypothetical protein